MSEKIGRFEIIGKLGRGAFGMVYKGRDPVINRLAAIKVMSEATVGDPELVSRFKREAEAAGGLNHRNIVTIYDLGEHNGLPYIAMEFLEGKDLEKLIKERTELALERKIDIVAQVAEGLHYAHGRGIVHRDIKPANIRILDDGTVKIMDFGIAKMSSSDMTRTGQFMGTVNYMSPEQIKAKKIDGRSDLFALGVVFYELVSYRRPFPGDSITAVIYKIVNENPPPLVELHGGPFEWLEGVVFKCLEKDVAKRWESTQALADALRQKLKVPTAIAESPIEATLNLARARAEAGDVESALRQLDDILEHDPDNSSVLKQRKSILTTLAIKQSETLLSSGRLEQARDRLLQIKQEMGESEEVARSLAQVEEKIASSQADQLHESAMRYLQDKRIDAAIEALQKAREIDPYNEKVRVALATAADEKRKADLSLLLADAKARLEGGQLNEARARVAKALEIDPASLEARALSQAVEREIETSSRKSGVEEALLQGRLALKKEEFERAIGLIEKGLALDPRNAELRKLLEQARQEHVRAGERTAVVEFVTQGKKLLGEKKFSEARLSFEKALKLDPTWEEAKAGVAAAQARRMVIQEPGGRRLGAPLIAVAVVAVVAAVVGIWFLTRPSPARVALAAGDAAAQGGQLDEAFKQYRAAVDLKGSDEDHKLAREKVDGLYQPLSQKGDLLGAKQIADLVAGWQGAEGVRGRYRELGEALGRRGLEKGDDGLLQSANQSYQTYLSGYKKSADYDAMRSYFQLGEELMQRGDDLKLPSAARLALFERAQDLFEFVDKKDFSFGADRLRAEARTKRAELQALSNKIAAFNQGVEAALGDAQKYETDSATWPRAVDAYDRVLKLVAENSDIAGAIDLDRYRDMASSGKLAINDRLARATAEAGEQQKVALVRGQAEALEKAGNLKDALAQYRELAKLPAGAGEARGKIGQLEAQLARAESLRGEARAALERKDFAAADRNLAEALGIVPGDADLAGLKAEVERQKLGAAAVARVASVLEQADKLRAAGKLDEAEAQYREVQKSTVDRAVLDRVNAALDDIRAGKIAAQVEPQVKLAEAAEAKGDLKAALAAWQEVERLNRTDPRVRQKLPEIRRQLNAVRIGELEKAIAGAAAGFDQNPGAYAKLRDELKSLDPTNAELVKAERRLQTQAAKRTAGDRLGKLDPDAALAALRGADTADPEIKALVDKAQLARTVSGALDRAERAIQAKDRDEALRQAEAAAQQAQRLGIAAYQSKAQDALGRARGLSAAPAATPAPAVVSRTPEPVATQAPQPAATETPAVVAATPVPQPRTDELGAARQAAQAGNWPVAAQALDRHLAGGGEVEGAFAGRVYYNGSLVAACGGSCDLSNSKAWATKAVSYDAAANRWAITVAKFSKCDGQMLMVCKSLPLK